MSNFRPIDRDMDFLLPPSVDEWLPERHLARFVVEVVDGLDLSAMSRSYRGSGSAPYHPSVLVGLLMYGDASGIFSSRQLERATYDSVAFRFVASNQHPDHDTVASFRRRFLPPIEALFVEVLQVEREMGLLKIGTIGLDGTKIHADASRHAALSWDYANRIEAQPKAEAADRADVPDGMSIPDELARREERLARIAAAKVTIEARAKERHARDKAAYEASIAERDAKVARTGQKPRGRPPAPPVEGPLPGEQVNLTDPESRIMPVAGDGFEQCYNAQAAVAADSDPPGRDVHHPAMDDRFAPPPPAPVDPTPLDAMLHRLKTPEGRALYGRRKYTPEPVFDIIKSVMGFRQFSLRGLAAVRGEWSLVTMAWNVKRMFNLAHVPA